MAWFIDKGQINYRNCTIRISRLNKKSTDACLEYFKIIDIPATIKKNGGSTVLSFEGNSREKLLKLITPCFPAFLRR
jgi:hypothetical protein